MYDALLFLHVLAAFMLFGTSVIYSAVALGAPVTPRGIFVADRLWDVGGAGTLVFGVWMAIDTYEITDAWILIALGLFAAATLFGFRGASVTERAAGGPSGGTTVVSDRSVAIWNWLRAATMVLLLLDMIFKPWA